MEKSFTNTITIKNANKSTCYTPSSAPTKPPTNVPTQNPTEAVKIEVDMKFNMTIQNIPYHIVNDTESKSEFVNDIINELKPKYGLFNVSLNQVLINVNIVNTERSSLSSLVNVTASFNPN